jgi:hypothetical protein
VANILLDADNWEDLASFASPPSWWTGSVYEWIGSVPSGKYYNGAQMQYNSGDVNQGDIVAGTIVSTSADNTEFSVSINGTAVDSLELTTNQSYTFNHTLAAGDAVIITLGVGDFLYSQDAILTPLAVQPIPTPPYVRLRWSDDGGHNWSNAQEASMGATGQTAQRVIFRRIGSTRRNTGLDRIFELSSDSDTQVALVGASIGDG